MPLYEYHCRKCDQAFELLVRGSEQPLCPECSSPQIEKLLSVPAAHMAEGGSLPVSNFTPCGMGGCGRPECD